MRSLLKLFSGRKRVADHQRPGSARRSRLQLETLEDRTAPAVMTGAVPAGGVSPAYVSSPVGFLGYTPDQIRHAYGIDAINIPGIVGNGSGQTIAIIDAYDDPNIASDVGQFDLFYGTAANGLNARPTTGAGAFFSKVNQSGGSTLPGVDPTGKAEGEEALDVEWAHAIAPGANIILVECNALDYPDLLGGGVAWAKQQPGVSVVSMSFSGSESKSDETTYDSTFTTPAGHAGVSFVASTGDTGTPGYPALSPNVLAVGGTSLTLDAQGNYSSETPWDNQYGITGGGLSAPGDESRPNYQNSVAGVVGSQRGIPDVAFLGDPDPHTGGAWVYDSYNGGAATPWINAGGTSLSAPAWAGLIAIVDQARVQNNLGTLDGPTQLLPDLYNGVPRSDFHDVTGGTAPYAATPGYDLVTGLGTPKANLLVSDLAPLITQQVTNNGTTFLLSSTGNVYSEQSTGAMTYLTSGVTSLVAGMGEVFELNSLDQVFEWNGSSFAAGVGANVTTLVGVPNAVLCLTASGDTYDWAAAAFAYTGTSSVTSLVAGMGEVFELNSSRQVFEWNGSSFATGVGANVTVLVGVPNAVLCLTASGDTYDWTAAAFAYTGTSSVTNLFAGLGEVFAVNTASQELTWNGSSFVA
jgi:subtilase family serine protease